MFRNWRCFFKVCLKPNNLCSSVTLLVLEIFISHLICKWIQLIYKWPIHNYKIQEVSKLLLITTIVMMQFWPDESNKDRWIHFYNLWLHRRVFEGIPVLHSQSHQNTECTAVCYQLKYTKRTDATVSSCQQEFLQLLLVFLSFWGPPESAVHLSMMLSSLIFL